MKINFVIFLITVFLIANTYYDGKFTDYLIKGKKYYKMATFAFVGLSIYLFINKNPNESKNLVKHATELIKYMPVVRSAVHNLILLLTTEWDILYCLPEIS